jgi:histidine kinase
MLKGEIMAKKSTVKPKMKIGTSFSRKILAGWIFSLFVPFIVLFVVAFVQYGDAFINVLSGDANEWHGHGYTAVEQLSRDINIWTNDKPVYQNHPELDAQLASYEQERFPMSSFIVERSGDKVAPLVPLTEEVAAELKEKFVDLGGGILPAYGQRAVSSNEMLLDKTGYVLFKQYDFHYADGGEGSIFFFVKYTDVPIAVLKFIGNNLLLVIGILFLIYGIMSFKFVRRVTKPIIALLDAMKRYQIQDFTPRLDEMTNENMFKTINIAVNDMAVKLQESQKKARYMENQRIEFLAKIAHDTKTPLASIRAHAEAFRDGLITDNEKRAKYTDNILKKVSSIDNMINELSLYSDLETGLNQYTFTSVDLNYYLMDILDELQYDYPEDELKIEYKVSKYQIMTQIDVDRFNRVLMNIVKNSRKYSGRDQTTINVSTKVNSESNIVTLLIADNGKGNDIKDTSQLFESFIRGDVSRDPNKSGSGLGLAIAKTIIERHDGVISIETKPDEYFKLIIELPLERGRTHEENIDNIG